MSKESKRKEEGEKKEKHDDTDNGNPKEEAKEKAKKRRERGKEQHTSSVYRTRAKCVSLSQSYLGGKRTRARRNVDKEKGRERRVEDER